MSGLERITSPTSQSWKSSASAEGKDKTTPERLLVEAVERMDAFREDRIAVHIHLSRLQQHHRKDHYLRIATETFETQVKTFAGQIFILTNGDIFFLGKDMGMNSLIEAVDKLRLLFAEDPVSQYSADDEERSFATYYDFMENYELLHQDVLILHKSAERLRRHRESDAARNREQGAGEHGRAFLPSDLSKLINVLERADLSGIMRRQTACVINDAGLPHPVFEEAYVSIDALQKICAPEIDLLSDRWLFHYLSRTLDMRVLTLMVRDGIRADLPFSLNLNIATLLSPEFRRFDDHVPAVLRGRMVIEIHKVDVFSDIGTFIFARDFAHDRGYKLCLDGLTHHTLPFFDQNKLGIDLFKIYWGPEGLKTAQAPAYEAIKKLMWDYGPDRTILCRCDDEAAITTGRQLGIRMFQGRAIDRLLSMTRKR